jgi:hypothetical protein
MSSTMRVSGPDLVLSRRVLGMGVKLVELSRPLMHVNRVGRPLRFQFGPRLNLPVEMVKGTFGFKLSIESVFLPRPDLSCFPALLLNELMTMTNCSVS